jgi:hypothetical protein
MLIDTGSAACAAVAKTALTATHIAANLTDNPERNVILSPHFFRLDGGRSIFTPAFFYF